MSVAKYTRNPYRRRVHSLRRRFRSYLRNPDPSKREQLENELLEAMERMEELEGRFKETHNMLSDLMQKFLTYAKDVEEGVIKPTRVAVDVVETEPFVEDVKPRKRRSKADPEKEEKIKKLVDLIMRRGKIKIDDAKELLGISEAKYIRPLLVKIMEMGLATKEGKTKATRYIWTGKRPDWMAAPVHYVDKSCPTCGIEMRKLGTWWKCPKKGCGGKKPYEAPERQIQRGPAARSVASEAEIISRVLNQTAHFPDLALTIDELRSQQKIKMDAARLEKLLDKQPELLVEGGVVSRRSDTLIDCKREGGEVKRIAFATRADGSQPARHGWLNLTATAIKTFTNLFNKTCLHGPIKDGSQFKRLEGNVWEFKSNKDKRRITCFYDADGTLFLATVFKKKEDKTPRSEVKLAEDVMKEHTSRALSEAKRRNPYLRYNPYWLSH